MSAISRRTTLAWVAAATASPWALTDAEAAPDAAQPGSWPETSLPPIAATGYGQDPNLVAPVTPWPLTLAGSQLAMLRTIADLMLPADAHSPSGGTLKLDSFVDEWISAPYPQQQRDRELILRGLAWLDVEAMARFGGDFQAISDAQRRMIFDAIAFRARVAPGYERPARFFARLRGLMMAGYYSLPEGFADIGYVGNAPSLEPYPGPPAEARAHLDAALAKLGLKTS